jgi:hypothetical protein
MHVRASAVSLLLTLVFSMGLIGVTTAVPASATVSCASGQPRVLFQGSWYCPGTVTGVKATAYGTYKRIVLKGVTVDRVASVLGGGYVVDVLGPETIPCTADFCGATITHPRLSIRFARGPVPATGDVMDLYGSTRTGGLVPIGYVVTGVDPCYLGLC